MGSGSREGAEQGVVDGEAEVMGAEDDRRMTGESTEEQSTQWEEGTWSEELRSAC